MAAAQSGAAQQKWPLYNPRLGVPLLKRIHIVHTQADNIVLEPLWNLKKGKQVEIIEKILFGAEKIYVDLRNRSAEKDEFVRYADSFAYGDDFWRIVAKLVMPGIGGRKGEERAVVMNNARLHKIKVLSAGRVPKIKRKETVDKVRESFFEFCKNTGGFGTLQKRSFLIEIGYTIFAEGLNKSHLFEANAETAYQKIKDEFALRRGNPEAKFTMDKLHESFQECADLFSKIHCIAIWQFWGAELSVTLPQIFIPRHKISHDSTSWR
ncbi:unnamed protein product [Amoebophrya sp. A25]|nr:unnamed protein product [Amoebophrya sp. A25]|eukprot:GSA25T00025505001.1